MSLDDFQARYTSEDNSSFTEILDEENRARKEKYGWAWEAQRKVEAQRDRMIEQREKLLIEAPSLTGVRGKFAIEAPELAGLLTDGRENEKDEGRDTDEEERAPESSLAVIMKTGEEPTDVMAPLKDKRAAGVDGWKFSVSIMVFIFLRVVDSSLH
jgi:protein DGCR14